MRFKIDENLPAELAQDLQTLGHDADTVVSEGLGGTDDPTLVAHCCREHRVLFTLDKGIGDIRQYPPEGLPGLVLFRPTLVGRANVLRFVRLHLTAVLLQELQGHLCVVSEAGIRIR